MMIKKYLHLFFISVVTLVISACVPKATEKKAVCGANQAFNNVSRSCVSITEIRLKPVATKKSDTLLQEVAKTLTLSYTDGNGNPALLCKVSGVSSNIEAVSPLVINGSIYTKADTLYTAALSLSTNLPAGADQTAALAFSVDMATALHLARTSFNYDNILNQLGIFQNAVTSILTIAAPYSSSFNITYFFNLSQTLFTDMNGLYKFVENRCSCIAGVCTTSIAPKIHESGAAGFSYTVSDIDGEGNAAGVTLAITALSNSTNFVLPSVSSNYVSVAESNTNIPLNYAFNLGTAADFLGTSTFTYAHNKSVSSAYFPSFLANKTYVNSDNSLGKVTNCLGLGGSLLTDTSCVYVPNDGDAYSLLSPAKASVLLSTDLTLSAKAEGTYGNNIIVYFKNINSDLVNLDGSHSTAAEKFGLVGATDDVYIRVIGNAIYIVFNDSITTTQEIADALNNDLVASNLVDASAVGVATPATVASAFAGVNLAGGIAGFDTFSYTVNNGFGNSTNTAMTTIKINSTLDNPTWMPFPSTSSPLMAIDDTATLRLEGATALSMPINVSTTYYDPDNVATTCTVSTDPLDLFIWSSGSNGLAGITAAEIIKSNTSFAQVMPIPTCTISGVAPTKIITFSVDRANVSKTNAFGNYALLFKITDGAALTTSLPTFQGFRFFITPINDRPDATAISWTTSSTTPTTSGSGATWAMTTRENSTASPSIASADITVNPDVTATGFEAAQTLTVGATSDNQTLLKNAKISIINVSATIRRISFTTEKNQSGTANISVTLTDNGGTANGGVNTYTTSIALTVTPVDDPPFFIAPYITTVHTNEGGMVIAGPFKVDEDEGSTADEDDQEIRIANIISDNPTVLPTSAITVFYDLNDNGILDTGEARSFGNSSSTVPVFPAFEPAPTTGVDSKLHNFYLKLNPVLGVSGNSNITIVMTDGNVAASHFVSTNFSFIVHSIAALHGGWSNIQALGIKTDKSGAPVTSSDIQCNYNKTFDVNACNSKQNCIGTSAPHGSITPDASNVFYWDSSNKKCYRSESTSRFSWVDVTTSCPVTRVFVSPTTLSANINTVDASMTVASTTGFPTAGTLTVEAEQISYTGKTITTFTGLTRGANLTTATTHNSPAVINYTANGENFVEDSNNTPVAGIPTPTGVNQFYLNTTLNQCFSSTELTPGVWSWNATAYVPSKVTLTWNPFTVSGSGPDSSVQVYGWNVYRREKGFDFDFLSGYLKTYAADTMTISDPNITIFTDTTAVAGKVYYYLVRPVDSSARHLTISTPEVFSEVRILAPTENFAFVHRWMMNQEVCNSMHMTTTTTNKVDPIHNYRCPYRGPAESAGFYDIGKDLLVDISESGCPYTAAPTCTANGCVGIGNPTTLGLVAPNESIFYDRSSGSCYARVAGAWTTNVTSLTVATLNKTSSALNAPLVNITNANASTVCSSRTPGNAFNNLGTAKGAVSDPAVNLSMPTKKEFIAYSASPFNMTDSLVTDLEQGFSLNVQSRCNSNNADGISMAYTDSTIPSTSYIFSLPGTASSNVRSLYTGSVPWGIDNSTESCKSRYGIQDVYGNVAEWVGDKMSCNAGGLSDNICKAVAGTDMYYDFGGGNIYGFDFLTGPYNNANGNSVADAGDGFLTNWDFRDEPLGAGKFSFPIGMPINVDIATASTGVLVNSPALPFILDIGPTAGITYTQLHQDGIIVNGAAIAGSTGSFAQGGSYLSGNRSGRFSSELIPTASTRPDVGFRCFVPVDKDNFPTDTSHPYSY